MSYGDVRVVDGVTLRIEAGEMLSLLGPSGCGKTSHLHGFSKLRIFSPHESFRQYFLRTKSAEVAIEKDSQGGGGYIDIGRFFGMQTRSIHQLSGGKQQRVALARALILKPAVHLLDEPLSNLDAKLRVETRIRIWKIQKSVGITSIFVTHNQEEALTIIGSVEVGDSTFRS